MGSLVLRIIGLIFVLLGVILIYDARIITKKFFGFGDQNEGSLGLKMVGFLMTLIGTIILFVIKI